LIKTSEPSNISGMSQSQEIAKLSHPISAASKDLLTAGYGDYQVLLPKDKSEAKEVWDNLKRIVDTFFGNKHP
jgi:hypothetical protein